MPDRRSRNDDDDDERRPRRRSSDRDDEDRPPRRRRDDEDEPRSRRRDDDEDDRPGRRRRDDDDDEDRPRPKRRRLSREKLRALAIRQKVIIFCILGYLIAVVAQFAVPQDLRILVAIPGLAIALTATIFVFLLAMEVHGVGMGILFGLLTLLPCVGLIMLIIVNQQATSLMQKNGVRVGLLGADMSDIR